MKYLLIDFGATYIKCATYNKSTDEYVLGENILSPFVKNNKLSKFEVLNILSNIISSYKDIDGIIICTILGGFYIEDEYHSWKSSYSPTSKNKCLISGLFNSIPHIHHKPFTTSKKYLNKLEIIGNINLIPVYSSLGDTDCVIKSINLTKNNIAINMGTGSQVITLNKIERYFPSGRMFLTFQEFFQSIGIDMFKLIDNISINDVLNSSLDVDLNVFPQSKNYKNGGSILNINENKFTVNNLLGSILREFILQYKPFVKNYNEILLLGGIAKKIHNLPELFQIYYPESKIILLENGIESTHKGMIKYIKEEL
jgi:hypothetical protein